MIIMNLKVNNLLAFKDFEVDFSYPKKIVDSYIENEHLKGHPNFRYKKVNIVMGANASGKTSLGRMIMNGMTFIDTKRFEYLTDCVNDTFAEAFLSMDFVGSGEILYNMTVTIAPSQGEKYTTGNLKVTVSKAGIGSRDSYESCSMEPRFKDEQLVWIEQTDFLDSGDIGLFYLDGKTYFKKYIVKSAGTFLLSLNAKYKPIPISEYSSFKIFGKLAID